MSLTIRPMRLDDVEAMLQVQAQCYPEAMNESRQVLADRWRACPDTAWVVAAGDGRVGAYLVAYRSRWGQVSSLGDVFAHQPQADVLYLHDLAMGEALRGRGVATMLVAHARAAARAQGLMGLALVSVNDTVVFWRRLGLVEQPVGALGRAALRTYPGAAVYMAVA